MCLNFLVGLNLQGNKKDSFESFVLRAGDGIRTHDLLLGKETFYQLNHARVFLNCESDFTRP